MRALVPLAVFLVLAGCQTTTRSLSVPEPIAAPIETVGMPLAEEEMRGTTSERRTKINACLADIGLQPLPEGFAQVAPPMTLDQTEAYNACMARGA